MRREAREGSLFGALEQEKRKKAGAIEVEKEGARYIMREHGNDFGFFFQGLLYSNVI